MVNLVIWALFFLPLLLVATVWRRSNRPHSSLVLLTLSGAFLVASSVPSAKHVLLGANYSNRLYSSLEINLALVLLIAGYLAFKRQWVALTGAAFLALDWLYLIVVNSVA